ncbi:rCG63578 [Rattus norvegicus]|uniref:RCG63578 n=1 Tax=Rattus norvegicus TaxID=10116 RepID=A6ICL7_RAT|nr:rCG63578 [Rattus norvegicus]
MRVRTAMLQACDTGGAASAGKPAELANRNSWNSLKKFLKTSSVKHVLFNV